FVIKATERYFTAFPEQADQFDGFFDALGTLIVRRPLVAENVLVERFAGADAEKEAARHHRRAGRRRLCDDGRMDAKCRAGHTGSELEVFGDLTDAADDAPDKRALSLLVYPRVEVIRDERKRKARLFGAMRIMNQIIRRVFFARQ